MKTHVKTQMEKIMEEHPTVYDGVFRTIGYSLPIGLIRRIDAISKELGVSPSGVIAILINSSRELEPDDVSKFLPEGCRGRKGGGRKTKEKQS